MGVYPVDGKYGLDVFVDVAFDIDEFVDGEEYCNTSRMYGDEVECEMGCGSLEKAHVNVQGVSARTQFLGDLRCTRHVESASAFSIFACA